VCAEGIWRIFEDRLRIVIYTGHHVVSPGRFERCIPSDMKIKGTCVSPSLSIAITSISTVLSSSISAFLYLPPPVRSLNFSIEGFRWRITDKATLRGVHEMLGVGWLPHQPSHAFDDVSTTVFDMPLVVVIPSHILECVLCPLPEILIIWHASHELGDAIPIVEAWETWSGVFFLQHVVIVHLHTLLLDHTLGIFVLYTRRKQEIGNVL